MAAMAIGIAESVQEEHIRARIGQVRYLGDLLSVAGVPGLVMTYEPHYLRFFQARFDRP